MSGLFAILDLLGARVFVVIKPEIVASNGQLETRKNCVL